MLLQKVDVHYMDSGAHYVIEDNFDGFLAGQSDVILPRILQAQEGLYQSLQSTTTRHATGELSVGPDQDDSPESQLALDEALARSLQDLENNLALVSLIESSTDEDAHQETSSTPAENTSSTSSGVATQMGMGAYLQTSREDPIDPDNMTYEELQSLNEFVGTESKGLPDDLISLLPTFVYKTGRFFSRRDKREECVICCMPYKNKENLISLPCQHHYHSKCITRWLKIKKACPICNSEVFGS